MRTTNLTMPQPDPESLEMPGRPANTVRTHPLSTADDGSRPPVEDNVISCRAAAEAWAAESGLTMQEFQGIYVEQCVADLLDQHPAWSRVDAERLVLSEALWLSDCAA